MDNLLGGTVNDMKLHENFGFIKPADTLPEPYVNKDVHFHFHDFYPLHEFQKPRVGDRVTFILRNDSYANPAAFMVFQNGYEQASDQPRPLAPDLVRGYASHTTNYFRWTSENLPAVPYRHKGLGSEPIGNPPTPKQGHISKADLLYERGGNYPNNASEDSNVESWSKIQTFRRKDSSASTPPPQLLLIKLGNSITDTSSTIVAIEQKAGLIMSARVLPEYYNQSRTLCCNVDNAKSGNLQFGIRNPVEVYLRTKDKSKPMAFSVRITECTQREDFIVVKLVKRADATVMDSCQTPADSILSCQAMWDCIGGCTSANAVPGVGNGEEVRRAVHSALFLIRHQYKSSNITRLASCHGQTALIRKKIRLAGDPSTLECNIQETQQITTQLACKHVGTHECCEKPESVLLPCSHPCQRKCCECEPCDHDCCEEYERIREKEAELLCKQQNELIKKVEEQTERDPKHLEKNWKEEVVFQELFPDGDTAAEYYYVEDQIKKYIQPGHKWFPIVKKIEKVSNHKLEKRWTERKRMAVDTSHVQRKFHETTTEATAKIIEEGFRIPPNEQIHGPGIYFANDSSKNTQDIYTKGSNVFVLLLCDVLLGKTLTVSNAQTGMTLQELKSKGYDSLFAKRGSQKTGGVLNDEFVVYHPDQAIPRYIVHYEKADVMDSNVPKQFDQLEAEAIATGKLVCHTIKPKREMKLNDPLEIHFRIAESQVLRLLKGPSKEIESVDYYINPPSLQQFTVKAAEFAKIYGKAKEADYIWAFHGTKPTNTAGIVKENFRIDKLGANFGNKGYYGAGIYFSEFPSVSIEYGQSVLLCKILPGKSYDCPDIMLGAGLQPGYNSHRYRADQVGRAYELVIFDSAQILPCYVIHFK